MVHMEQKGWEYLIRVKNKRGILSGLRLSDTPEFDLLFSYSLSKRLTNRIRQEPQKYLWFPSKGHFDYIADASDTLSACQKSPPASSGAHRHRNKFKFVVSDDMRVGNDTSHARWADFSARNRGPPCVQYFSKK